MTLWSLDSPDNGPYVPGPISGPPLEVSVVLPVHNERDNLAPLLEEIHAVLSARPHEIIAVDDASSDGSLDELRRLQSRWPVLRVLALSRRSGQSAATLAGCDAARGEIVVTLDADGQNDPADIPRFLSVLREHAGIAAIVGARARARETAWRGFQSWIANRVRDWITGDRVRDSACGIRAIRRPALGSLPRFDGMHRFLPTLIRLGGWTVAELPVRMRPRRYGRSKYHMWQRATQGLRDALGVRWLARRALRYTVREFT
ncbi:MAG TPA: glycosyltransferase family 2 protein [Gemmatimonadales bacterium]|nr:glycosyltransferase family 2 protein [Gemmatimonadales bacterium]